jgi:hypothetical protein
MAWKDDINDEWTAYNELPDPTQADYLATLEKTVSIVAPLGGIVATPPQPPNQ